MNAPTLNLLPSDDTDEDFDHKRRDALATAGRILVREADDTSDVKLLNAGRSLIEQARNPKPPVEDSDDFDWSHTNTEVVQWSCPSIAVYQNRCGHIVIRTEREWDQDEDPYTMVSKAALPALIARLQSFLD